MMKLNVPAAVGAPDKTPVNASSVRSSGGAPADTVHETGGFAPVCVNVTEYGVPTWPLGTVVGPTVIVGHTITSDGATDPVHPTESVAVTVKLNGPAWAGIPASCPAAARFNPAGSVPAVMVNVCGGVPLVANSCE
jgi:hypothetical protein